MSITAMRQALEALETARRFVYSDNRPQCDDAITALRTAIAEAEKQESAITVTIDEFGLVEDWYESRLSQGVHTLYTTPPQRQPLTDEQRRNIVRANKMRHDSDEIDPYGVIDDVEAAHGITGEKT